MIVLHETRSLVFTAPKTASTSLHYALVMPPFSGESPGFFDGARTWIPGQHDMGIPPGREGYRVLVACRNPYDRAVSLWKHLVHGESFGRSKEALGFGAFADRLACGSEEPFYQWTQSRWYRDFPRIDGLLRVERLESDIRALGLTSQPFSVPGLNVNRGDRAPWQHQYRLHPESLATVRAWAAEDFEAFGYGP